MNEETSITNEPEKKAPVKKRAVGEQDQRIQNEITAAAAAIRIAQQSPEIAQKLQRIGYDAAELAIGLDLAANAQNGFTLRQSKIGNRESKLVLLNDAEEKARAQNRDFREIVRIAFANDTTAQRALGVLGATPRDRDRFITLAQASYSTAGQPPYSTELSRRSYDATGLTKAVATLTAFEEAYTHYKHAVTEAIDATEARNTAYRELRTWRISFNRAMKIATK